MDSKTKAWYNVSRETLNTRKNKLERDVNVWAE